MIDFQQLFFATGEDEARIGRRSGIEIERLRQILKGGTPSLEEVAKICGALKITPNELLIDLKNLGEDSFIFRAIHDEQLPKNPAHLVLSRHVSEIVEIIGESKKPKWLDDIYIEKEDYISAENLSIHFRNIFFNKDNISPIYNLPELLSNVCDILYFNIDNLPVDGASSFFKGSPFIYISTRFPPRMLFTLAHELGHLLAHHKNDFFISDNSSQKKQLRKKEYFANAFASCLLIPTEGVSVTIDEIKKTIAARDDVIGDIEIIYLSRIYSVSFEVAAQRCEDIKLIPNGGSRALYEAICKSHGSPEKRAEELGLPARPEINFDARNPRLVEILLRESESGDLSFEKISELLYVEKRKVLSIRGSGVLN